MQSDSAGYTNLHGMVDLLMSQEAILCATARLGAYLRFEMRAQFYFPF